MSGRGIRDASDSISLEVVKWHPNQVHQLSPVKSIGGYPWRLRLLERSDGQFELFVICDKSKESELWECKAAIKIECENLDFVSNSWTDTHEQRIATYDPIPEGSLLEVTISVRMNLLAMDRWTRRPIFDPFEPRDGVLVTDDERKIQVNKQYLASQSVFFDRMFNVAFKEMGAMEMPIGDVGYEEFINVLKMALGFEGSSLTDENVYRVLELAARFDLKIVEERVINFLLSSSSLIPIHQKVLLSEELNIPFLKDKLISQYTAADVKDLSKSPDWDLLSQETIRAIVSAGCDRND